MHDKKTWSQRKTYQGQQFGAVFRHQRVNERHRKVAVRARLPQSEQPSQSEAEQSAEQNSWARNTPLEAAR
jgi:hypothetical protein